MSYQTDEGCSEADWLRLNLELWKHTGENRFLEMAERLLWNHYAMNRTANGGYGHHDFVCDPEGPLLIKAGFTEAVWCCTFHGPWLLLANSQTPRPVVVALAAKGGGLRLPVAGHGSCSLVTVGNLQAAEDEIAQASRAQKRLPLQPWEETRRDLSAA